MTASNKAGIAAALLLLSSISTGLLAASSPLAVNLPELRRWNPDWPLINEMKRADVLTQKSWDAESGSSEWNTDELAKVDWDENGWPRSLSAIADQSQTFDRVSYLLFDNDYSSYGTQAPPAGYFHVFYDGEGTLEYSLGARLANDGDDVSSCGEQCDVVYIDPSDAVAVMSIVATDPAQNGDYLRNIEVIWPGGICEGDRFNWMADAADCEGQFESFDTLREEMIFHPTFVADLQRFRALRFLDYQQTNLTMGYRANTADAHSPVTDVLTEWDDRRKPEFSVWSDGLMTSDDTATAVRRGVPPEMLVTLSNAANKDPWFLMPYNASDDYVAQFASMALQQLKRGQTVYVEYGNEAWNSAAPYRIGYLWLAAKADDYWPDSERTEWEQSWAYYSKRTVEVCDIWRQVWADQPERLQCVMSSQSASTEGWMAGHLLDCPAWSADSRNPKRGTACHEHVDVLAIAPYFGGALGNIAHQPVLEGACGAAWDVADVMTELSCTDASCSRLPGCDETVQTAAGALTEVLQEISDNAEQASLRDVALVAYEAGQHLTLVGDLDAHPQLSTLFTQANRDPAMQSVYQTYLDNWRDNGGTMMTLYHHTSRYSKFGNWGLKEHQTQINAPKMNAVDDFVDTNDCWWAGCEKEFYSLAVAPEAWQQLSLPCVPDPGENSLASLLADDVSGNYGWDWIMFSYQPLSAQYELVGLDDALKAGQAYWFMQLRDAPAILDLPASCRVPSEAQTESCEGERCYSLPLQVQEGAVTWQMRGLPLAFDVSSARTTLVADGACESGCSLNETDATAVLHHQFWHYNPATEAYDVLQTPQLLKPWHGYWMATVGGNEGQAASLMSPLK